MLNLYRLLLPAVLAVASLDCDPVCGQEKPPGDARPAASGEQAVLTGTAYVERALSSPAPEVRFNDTPLEEALKALQEGAKVNLLVDWTNLTDNGISRDKPITLQLRNVPLRVVLTEVLRQAGGETALGYRVRDGLVRVATQGSLSSDAVLLDEIQFKDTSLPKVIQFLRSADPSFKVIVAGDPGVAPDELIISELDLRKVTASQVLEALQMAYPQRIKVAGTGDDPPVWTVRVMLDRSPGGEQVTSVFRLREAIDRVQKDMGLEDRVKARGAVLQLLENVLRMNPSRPEASAVLQLHEATDMLVFRGTGEEMMIVQNALRALVPPEKAPTPPPSDAGKTPHPPA